MCSDYSKKKIDEIRNLGKILPYVNSEHISNVNRINSNSPYGKNLQYMLPSNRYKNLNEKYYVKNIDKYYEYNNVMKSNKNSSNNINNMSNILDVSQNYGSPVNIKIVPNRKLSPINNKKIALKI